MEPPPFQPPHSMKKKIHSGCSVIDYFAPDGLIIQAEVQVFIQTQIHGGPNQ